MLRSMTTLWRSRPKTRNLSRQADFLFRNQPADSVGADYQLIVRNLFHQIINLRPRRFVVVLVFVENIIPLSCA
jgi:hypothetical protein